MSDKPKWTGRIRKGDEPGTVVGWMTDEWGWRIEVHGVLDRATHEYVLTGNFAAPPESLRVAAIDGERT